MTTVKWSRALCCCKIRVGNALFFFLSFIIVALVPCEPPLLSLVANLWHIGVGCGSVRGVPSERRNKFFIIHCMVTIMGWDPCVLVDGGISWALSYCVVTVCSSSAALTVWLDYFFSGSGRRFGGVYGSMGTSQTSLDCDAIAGKMLTGDAFKKAFGPLPFATLHWCRFLERCELQKANNWISALPPFVPIRRVIG